MDKLVLIKERYDLQATTGENSNIIYLEAPVAVFGQKNNNNRIYEESNYLPLLEELQYKITNNNLTGELDHPGERLEVFLSNVSHKIEELKYDKANKTVKAKIRLIEGTTAGDNAIALHKAGITLGISSRAIGVIKEGKALLKKIITFDIVSTPGFKDAMLKPINESIEYESSANDIAIYEITDEKYINKYKHLLESNDTNGMDEKTVKTILDSINMLKDEIKAINEKFSELDEYNQSHIAKLNEFVSKVNKETSELTEFKENFIAYNESETEKLKTLKNDVTTIDEAMNQFISLFEGYSEKQANTLNAFIEHQANETNKLNEFVEHQANETNKLNEFVEHQANETTKLNSIVEFLDEQSDKLQKMVEHQHNEAKKLNTLVEWADSNFENLYENATFKTFINKQNTLTVNLESISESVDMVLNNVRKQKTFKDTVLNKYPFLSNVSEDLQQEFLGLDESRKTMVVKELGSVETINESEFTNILNNTKVIELPIWLNNAPDSYKNAWASMNESQQEKIYKLAALRNFKSVEDVSKFWDDLQVNKELVKINETVEFNLLEAQKNINKIQDNNKLGYSKEYIEQIKQLVKQNK